MKSLRVNLRSTDVDTSHHTGTSMEVGLLIHEQSHTGKSPWVAYYFAYPINSPGPGKAPQPDVTSNLSPPLRVCTQDAAELQRESKASGSR